MKFSSQNTETIYPKEILQSFKKYGIDKEKPSVYSMMAWIANANEYSGTSGMTFQELLNYSAYFFSQRQSEEGLKYVFELFDPERRGFLDRKQLDSAFSYAGINLEQKQLNDIFAKASSDGKVLKFSEFAFFMRATE